uniref:C2H2-type domain-containing protein n=1 Tax=Echeneis naucrates TaxID=173247 RepID=A0A665T8J7_ECHNA
MRPLTSRAPHCYAPQTAKMKICRRTPRNLCGDVTENARESFEAPDASTGVLVPDMLYGEPLSREDSSCDTDETGLGANKSKKTIVAKTNLNSADHSEEQMSPLQSSREMRNHLQPVVLLKTLESVNGSTSYHCGNCQHTTYNVDSLIEHHHCCHSVAPKTFPRHKCNLCPAVFCYSSGKYRHMKKHELFKLTGKMFRYRNSVFSMSKTATPSNTNDEEGEMNRNPALSCEFCGKYFATSQSLKKHERSHRGERPYHCLECGKGFKRHSHLIVQIIAPQASCFPYWSTTLCLYAL